MKKRYSILVMAAFVAIGCGKSPQGTYTGIETQSYPQQTGTTGTQQPYNNNYGYGGQSGQVSIQINDNGNAVSGTYTTTINGQGSQSFQITGGTRNGDQIQNVIMIQTQTQPAPQASGSPYGGYYPNNGYGASNCTYQGTITIKDNSLNATFTSMSQGGYYGSSCPTRTVIANRSS